MVDRLKKVLILISGVDKTSLTQMLFDLRLVASVLDVNCDPVQVLNVLFEQNVEGGRKQ